MRKKICSLIYGDFVHYIDHLAPLSFFLNIPLVTNEKKIFDLIKRYYPKVKPLYISNIKINQYVVNNFDQVVGCMTKNQFDIDFRLQQDIFKKNIDTIWCPHGNSDKGKTILFMEALMNEKNILHDQIGKWTIQIP